MATTDAHECGTKPHHQWMGLKRASRCAMGDAVAVYDTFNRRVRKTITTNDSQPKTNSPRLAGGGRRAGIATSGTPCASPDFYSGWQVMEERVAGINTPLRQYVWGNYIDECIWMGLTRASRCAMGDAAFVYDTFNRRVRKTITTNDSQPKTHSPRLAGGGRRAGVATPGTPCASPDFYSSWQAIEERVAGTNTPLRQYVWGLYIDECIQLTTFVALGAQNLPAGTYYLLQDLLYRAVALTNSTGGVVEAYDTDAYGNTIIFTAPDASGNWWSGAATQGAYGANEIIFCGYRFDPETVLYYVRNRTYHPVLGRWIQRDPIWYARDIGLYLYGGGRVPIAIDPSGNEWVCDQPAKCKGYNRKPRKPGCRAWCKWWCECPTGTYYMSGGPNPGVWITTTGPCKSAMRPVVNNCCRWVQDAPAPEPVPWWYWGTIIIIIIIIVVSGGDVPLPGPVPGAGPGLAPAGA